MGGNLSKLSPEAVGPPKGDAPLADVIELAIHKPEGRGVCKEVGYILSSQKEVEVIYAPFPLVSRGKPPKTTTVGWSGRRKPSTWSSFEKAAAPSGHECRTVLQAPPPCTHHHPAASPPAVHWLACTQHAAGGQPLATQAVQVDTSPPLLTIALGLIKNPLAVCMLFGGAWTGARVTPPARRQEKRPPPAAAAKQSSSGPF